MIKFRILALLSILPSVVLGSSARSEEPALGTPASSEREQLLALHQEVLEAHLDSDIDRLMEAEAEESVVANRGEIGLPSPDERRSRLGPYLAATNFTVYRDMVPPVVRVSEDGTLGWVIAQVEAVGTQRSASGEPGDIRFQSAWIELYAKHGGVWKRVGNVSNFAAR